MDADTWADEIKSKHLVKLLCKTLNLMHRVDINGCRGSGIQSGIGMGGAASMG
jgi:hypothetical protein